MAISIPLIRITQIQGLTILDDDNFKNAAWPNHGNISFDIFTDFRLNTKEISTKTFDQLNLSIRNQIEKP